jgi:hypothetical protein
LSIFFCILIFPKKNVNIHLIRNQELQNGCECVKNIFL